MNGNDGNCEDDEIEQVVLWLSLAAVGIAIIFVILGILTIEIIYRKRKQNESRVFSKLERTVAKHSSEM